MSTQATVIKSVCILINKSRHCICILIFAASTSYSQMVPFKDMPKKGSYLYYGQPAFEDNSFLLEEAFNQEMGILQHVFNVYWDNVKDKTLTYSFTQEIPITNLKHQLSYTLSYTQSKDAKGLPVHGFGDMYISYRPLLLGEKDWAMVIPRFTIILPTGSAKENLGSGAIGGQFNLAVTKRLSRKVVTHYNAGATYFLKSDRYEETNFQKVLVSEKNLFFKNVGASVIWYPTRKFNLMLEYVSNFLSTIEEDNGIAHRHQKTINPGIRYCIDTGKMQIVPGIGVPLRFEGSHYHDTGVFLYLSFEPDYLPFYKSKMN